MGVSDFGRGRWIAQRCCWFTGSLVRWFTRLGDSAVPQSTSQPPTTNLGIAEPASPSNPMIQPDAFGRQLGMHEPISRRDFINGTLVAGAGAWLGGRMPI